MKDDVAMTEVGNGEYDYEFTEMIATRAYSYVMNPNSALAYVETWFVDPRISNLDKSISEIIGWGGSWYNASWFTTQVTNLRKEFKEIKDILSAPKKEPKEIDFKPIIDKIDSIKIPELKFEEKEAKKAIKLIDSVDKKLSGYIDKEMSEKEELSAITREFTKLEMEEEKKHKEKKLEIMKKEEEDRKREEENDEKELELIKDEFERQDEMEKEEKRKELEAELKELEKEMKEKEKELKTL